MITVRKSQERGHAERGWLESYHTFSFADYHDPKQMGFRSLRVINEDWIAPEHGFGAHPHRDMEIVTYVMEGELAHKDSLGTGSVIRPGEVQRMSAGTGIVHSEMNPSPNETAHLLQIWILPERNGLTPEYEQRQFAVAEGRNQLHPIAAPDGREGALRVHQDLLLYAAVVDGGRSLRYDVPAERHAWLQVVRGAVTLNGVPLVAGDGAAVSEERALEVTATEEAEFLLFDLA